MACVSTQRVGDSASVTANSSLDLSSCDVIVESCGNADSTAVELDSKPGQFHAPERISVERSQSVGESLPSLSNNDSTLPSCSTLSASCCVLSPCTSSGGPASSAEIPSVVVVADSGISTASPESCLSSSRINVEVSDTDTVEELDVTFEPFCRICQLPSDGATAVDSTLVSPCRCAGSLQYTHPDCLVVSHVS